MSQLWDFLTRPMNERAMSTLKFWAGVGGTVVAFAVGYTKLEARVATVEKDKAEKIEMREVEAVLKRLDERSARIDRWICRQRPDDLGC